VPVGFGVYAPHSDIVAPFAHRASTLAWRRQSRPLPPAPWCARTHAPAGRGLSKYTSVEVRKRYGTALGLAGDPTQSAPAESGAGDEVIMSIAGHVSRARLSRYSHVRMEAKRRALDEIATRQRAADEKRKAEAERQQPAAAASQPAVVQ
jgi:hypothetical protein